MQKNTFKNIQVLEVFTEYVTHFLEYSTKTEETPQQTRANAGLMLAHRLRRCSTLAQYNIKPTMPRAAIITLYLGFIWDITPLCTNVA